MLRIGVERVHKPRIDFPGDDLRRPHRVRGNLEEGLEPLVCLADSLRDFPPRAVGWLRIFAMLAAGPSARNLSKSRISSRSYSCELTWQHPQWW
jgi:hypothetical protein